MSAQITLVTGSPNQEGNTNRLVRHFVEETRNGGHQVEVVDATVLRYATTGCTACMVCQKQEPFVCVIEDELSPILARLPESDILVFATPVYWFGPTAQFKLFFDRMFSLVKISEGPAESALQGKKMGLIATGGGGESDGLANLMEMMQKSAVALQCDFEAALIPYAPFNPDEMETRGKAVKKVRDLAHKLAG